MKIPAKITSACATIAHLLLVGAMIDCTLECLAVWCPAQDSPSTYPVDGVVENSLTQRPIARVLIEGRAEAVLTDGEGRFELHLPAGLTQILLRRPGYTGDSYSAPGMGHSIIVGPKTPSLAFYLTPSASISGHVMLSTGDDAEGFEITLYRRRVADGHSRWEQAGKAVTRSDGAFRLLSLEAATSYVLCSAPSPDRFGAAAPGSPVYGYPGACYPGGADVASAVASPLKLGPGEQAQIEISLRRQPFLPVSISVANSAPNANVQVFDPSGGPMGFGMRRDNQTGSFEVALPNGGYFAEARIWGKSQLYGRVDFSVAGAPLSGLTIVPVPVPPIKVEVHREFTADSQLGSRPAINSNRETGPGINLTLIPADKLFEGPVGMGLKPAEGSSDSDLYEVDAPPQGVYWVDAFGHQSYVSSISTGSTDLFREPMTIGSGSSGAPVEITLRNDTGRLECRAKKQPGAASGGNPIAEDLPPVFVYAIPQFANQRRIYQSVAQLPRGMQFPLPLPPGNYLVVAFRQAHEIDLDDPEEMSRLAAQGQTVAIEPGATTQVQVDPIPAAGQEASQ